MGIFTRTKKDTLAGKEEKTVFKATKVTKSGVEKKPTRVLSRREEVRVMKKTVSRPNDILRHLRVTEKTALLSESGAYTFEVDPRFGKKEIAEAVKTIYKVTPIKINVISIPKQAGRMLARRGKRGTTPAVKKAIVTLKKGEKIEFV